MKDNSNRVITLVLLGWLCFAVGLGGWFQNAGALAVAATVWTLTAFVLLACWKVRTIRACVLHIDLRWLVLLHLTRLFAGAYFLVLWNTLGLIDIIFVVSSALRFGLKDWQSMHALRELPLSLLPTFLVPLIIASHVLIFVRLTRARISSQ